MAEMVFFGNFAGTPPGCWLESGCVTFSSSESVCVAKFVECVVEMVKVWKPAPGASP